VTERDVEEVFRAANERLDAVVPAACRPVICECGDQSCMAVIELEPQEYERIRASEHFILLPGHENHRAEHVVECGDGFVVVEKI
jgi:hypothetical protein